MSKKRFKAFLGEREITETCAVMADGDVIAASTYETGDGVLTEDWRLEKQARVVWLPSEREMRLEAALRDCYDGWRKGEDVAGPMHRAEALLAEGAAGEAIRRG